MTKSISLVWILALPLLLFSFDFDAYAAKMGTIKGQVFAGDTPIKPAFFLVHNSIERTDSVADPDSDGKFRVVLPAGLYDLFVSDATFLPVCRRVEVIAGQDTEVTVKLTTDDQHLERGTSTPAGRR